MPDDCARADLQDRWLDLTRRILPGMAADQAWPVRADHCFQRIFLDNACGGVWYDSIARRPAYVHAPEPILRAAVAMAEAAAAGIADLPSLNDRSLRWRRGWRVSA